MTADRHTLHFIQRRFEAAGIRPQTRHGQNFLVDLNLVRLLAESAAIEPCDVVLEVGTGTGSLTAMLAARAAHVVTVEIDRGLADLAEEALEGNANVTLLHLDALKSKNQLHPEVIDAVRSALQAAPERRFKLAANLPYSVATPVLSNLLEAPIVPVSMTATIQRELALRIVAAPSTKDYSALSVWMQSQCRLKIVRTMPPDVFWPRPKVESAIIHAEVDPDRVALLPDRAFFHRFVRAIFFHRRKFLRSVASSAFKSELTKVEVDRILADQGLGPTSRAEELTVPQMRELCERFRQAIRTA
jgi:16S rRNA (adenine1518-N6/adenine1519-N6)-dimethyltransferase